MTGVSNKVAEVIGHFLSDNFMMKSRAIYEIVTNNTPEKQNLMSVHNMGERKFDSLNKKERTGILIMLNAYFFRQDEFCGQHAH
jgi:hypothetical protein